MWNRVIRVSEWALNLAENGIAIKRIGRRMAGNWKNLLRTIQASPNDRAACWFFAVSQLKRASLLHYFRKPKRRGAKMKQILLLCALLIGQTAFGQMTHEETIVRTAYAKFAYAQQQGVIGSLALEVGMKMPVPQRYAGMTAEQRLAAEQITFVLGNFVVGDVRDILDRRAVELISPAAGETLNVVGVTQDYAGTGAGWRCFVARWQPAVPQPPSLSDIKLRDLYHLQWEKDRPETVWQRYASYTVTIRFRDKVEGPYRALFIFGHDPSGNELVEPEDGVVDVSGLAYALHDRLFPDGLVLTKLRTYPVVANWLQANQVSSPTCSVGQSDVCCDLIKLKCGPGRDDVAKGLSKPLRGPKP